MPMVEAVPPSHAQCALEESEVASASFNGRCGICPGLAIAALCLAAMLLEGCASTTTPSLRQAHLKAPVRVVVVQAPMVADAGRLQEVLASDVKQALSVSDEPLASHVSHAQERASAAMSSALAQTPSIVIVAPSPDEQELMALLRGYGMKGMISQDETDRLRTVTGTDMLLRYRITDYGLTPRAWRNGFIAFEVTTTLAFAAVIAYSGSKAAKAVAGIYLVQEAIEETATAYAGFWALDETCRPVRIEAELIGLNPVRTLWQTSNTGVSDVGLSRMFRTIGTDERDRQLDDATDDAVKGIVSDISRAVEDSVTERAENKR